MHVILDALPRLGAMDKQAMHTVPKHLLKLV